jgi:thioredoxin reductase/bacterioferritin-associated ferredoxin
VTAARGDPDLIVLGAGPAGTAAAIEADALGLATLLLDEAPAAGGQVHRAPSPALLSRPADAEARAGDAMRHALAASGVVHRPACRVWSLARGFRVTALGPDGPEDHEAPALILATGATERVLPCPGWTLPGVFGLAAATILLKAEHILPGRRVVVAGTGPLLALVAAKLLAAGAEVAAVVDARPRADWLRAAPALAARPDLLARGLGWLARLAAARVPVLAAHAVARIEGTGRVERVAVVPLAAPDGPPRVFDADAVCLGHGLLPATEASRLLGARHVFDAARGGWVPELDAARRTSLRGLYACGDGAGLAGAAAAPLSGRLAALAAARDLGRLDESAFAARAAPLRAALARAARFGRAMAALSEPPPALLDLVAPDTLVCRCEGVTRGALERAVAAGAATLNEIKAATRCGMGPCGGRVCAEPAALLLARATDRDRAAIAPATARPPLRPVPLGALAGGFRYEDLPIPEPAPL